MAMKPCKECKASVSTSAKTCPHCGKSYPTGGVTIPAKIGLAVLGFFVLGSVVNNLQTGETTEGVRLTPNQEAIQQTEVSMQWTKGGFDSVMLADIVIKNNSTYPIKDIKLKCTHYAKSGTQIDSNTKTIFDVVPPKSQKAFKRFNMGFIHSQVETSACKIVSLEVTQ